MDNFTMASDFNGAFLQYLMVQASDLFAIDRDWSDAELTTIPCTTPPPRTCSIASSYGWQ